jgi:hypothetical protein
VPLGVTDDISRGAIGQLVYPFRSWARDAFDRNDRASQPAEASLRVNT